MKPDDPKLTAYALDELDPADRAEVEELLRENPEALAEVEDTERLAARLRRELQAEPAAPLTAEQRDEVLAAAVAGVSDPGEACEPERGGSVPVSAAGVNDPGYSRRWWSRPLALAASIAVLAGAGYLAHLSMQEPTPRSLVTSGDDFAAATGEPPAQSWSGQDGAIRLGVSASAPVPAENKLLASLPALAAATDAPAPTLPISAPHAEAAEANLLELEKLGRGMSARADGTEKSQSLALEIADNGGAGEKLDEATKLQEDAVRVPRSDPAAATPAGENVAAAAPVTAWMEGPAQRKNVPELRTMAGHSNVTPDRSRDTARYALAPKSAAAPAAPRLAPAKPSSQPESAGDALARSKEPAPGAAASPRFYSERGRGAVAFATDADAIAVPAPADPKSLSSAGVAAVTGTSSLRSESEVHFGGRPARAESTEAGRKLNEPIAFSVQIEPGEASKPAIEDAVKAYAAPYARTREVKVVTDRMELAKGRLSEVQQLDRELARDGLSDEAKAAKVATREAKAAELKEIDTQLRTVLVQTREKQLQEQPAGAAPALKVDGSGNLVLGDLPVLGYLFQQTHVPEEVRLQREPSNTESYDAIKDNDFIAARGDNALSTFSIDVDTASYANVRRFLNEQRLPPKGAVRIEELLNYFDYDYPQPDGEAPFSASMEVAACPWTPEHRLVRIGLKGRDIHPDKRPASNLVFLVDVSGSMQPENKLPLVKKCLRQLIDKLGGEDTVAIAVYAGASGCVLEPTNKKSEMRAALDRLESGGSTNGAAGIQLAYQLAERSFIKGGVNRVILATDGDFNVGVTNQSDLVDLIEKKAKSGVFLTVLGFGMGNLKDSTLEKLADKGNGNYAYIDTLLEGRKVLVEQMSGTLVTIAKDVKIQVEFNPAQVGSYRLIGYENRMLKKEDFNDDTKDAGEIGAGHTVTALYEVVPAGGKSPTPAVDGLKYQSTSKPNPSPAVAEEIGASPGDAFVRAYLLAQQAERFAAGGDADAALLKYHSAAKLIEQIGAKWPEWQPKIVEYRRARVATAIAGLETKLGRANSAATSATEAREKNSEEVQLVEQAVIERESKIQNPKSKITSELLTLKLRYKAPDGDTSKLLEFPLTDEGKSYERSSRDFRFAAAVASFGMLLRDSPHKGKANWSSTLELAIEGKGEDRSGYRAEFVGLIERAKAASR